MPVGAKLPPENQVVSFGCGIHTCVDMALLCVEGRSVPDLCLVSPQDEWVFWGIWMKVIPDALITLTKNLTEKTESPLFSGIVSLLDTRKNKPVQACSETSVLLYFFFYSISLSSVNRILFFFFCPEGLVDPKLCLKYCLLL